MLLIKGSALTTEQSLLLKRFCDRVILALDADFAGNAAAMRGIRIAEDSGLEVKVATLGNFKDPDDAVRENLAQYRQILKNAKSVWDFLIDSVFDKYDANTGSGKQKISREIVPILSSISDSIVQAHYVGLVSRRLMIDEDVVLEQLGKTPSKSSIFTKDSDEKSIKKSRRELLEQEFLSLAFQFDPQLLDKDSVELIKARKFRRIVEDFVSFRKPKKKPDLKNFARKLPKELVETFEELMMVDISGKSTDHAKQLEQAKNELMKLQINEEETQIQAKIARAESQGNKKEVGKLQKQHAELIKKQSALSD